MDAQDVRDNPETRSWQLGKLEQDVDKVRLRRVVLNQDHLTPLRWKRRISVEIP